MVLGFGKLKQMLAGIMVPAKEDGRPKLREESLLNAESDMKLVEALANQEGELEEVKEPTAFEGVVGQGEYAGIDGGFWWLYDYCESILEDESLNGVWLDGIFTRYENVFGKVKDFKGEGTVLETFYVYMMQEGILRNDEEFIFGITSKLLRDRLKQTYSPVELRYMYNDMVRRGVLLYMIDTWDTIHYKVDRIIRVAKKKKRKYYLVGEHEYMIISDIEDPNYGHKVVGRKVNPVEITAEDFYNRYKSQFISKAYYDFLNLVKEVAFDERTGERIVFKEITNILENELPEINPEMQLYLSKPVSEEVLRERAKLGKYASSMNFIISAKNPFDPEK